MTTTQFSNSDDVIDSRDIIERIEYLSVYDYQVCPECGCTEGDVHNDGCSEPEPVDNLTEEDKEELATLDTLQDQCEGYASDWKNGATLIRDSYFKEYTMHLAEDLGYINRYNDWPLNCIDWEKAAEELQVDYTEVDYDGVSYWVR
jgi:hypothetical protein